MVFIQFVILLFWCDGTGFNYDQTGVDVKSYDANNNENTNG